MRAVIGTSPAQQENILLSETLLYHVDHRDGAAFPYEYRRFAEPGLYGFLRRQHRRGVSRNKYGSGFLATGGREFPSGKAAGRNASEPARSLVT